jgi:hypothetical protein
LQHLQVGKVGGQGHYCSTFSGSSLRCQIITLFLKIHFSSLKNNFRHFRHLLENQNFVNFPSVVNS